MIEKPKAWFDLETTGVDKTKDRIIEIAIIRFDGDKRFEYTAVVNPGIPIPQSASDVHGFTDEMVADKPLFESIAKKVHNILSGCDLYGYNSNAFDIPFIVNELDRCGYVLELDGINFIDPCIIFKRKEERTLTAALKFYCDKEHDGAHGALADVQASIDVYEAQLKHYDDLPEDLNLYCNYDKKRCDISGNFALNENDEYIFNFGKHKGAKLSDQKSYLQWMYGQDFASDTKKIISLFI